MLRQAFEDGCGIPYETVRRSGEYKALLRQELRLADAYAPRTNLGKALRQNQYDLVRRHSDLLNGAETVCRPRGANPPTVREARERAMLRLLGTKLVDAADSCLPESCNELVQDWHAAEDGADRFSTLFRFFIEMQLARPPYDPPEPSEDGAAAEAARQTWVGDLLSDGFTSHLDFPRQYGSFGVSKKRPSCLGMAMMLVAFARRLGAEILLANTLDYPPALAWRYTGWVSRQILSELTKGRILAPRGFRMCLEQNWKAGRHYMDQLIDFHLAIAVKIEPEIWAFIDPYCNTVGLVSCLWKLSETYGLLNGLDPVQPGLTFVREDGGLALYKLEKARKKAARCIRGLRRLQRAVSITEFTPEEFGRFFDTAPGLLPLSELERDLGGFTKLPDRRETAMRHLFGWGPLRPSEEKIARSIRWFCDHEQYRKRCLNSLYASYLVGAEERYSMDTEPQLEAGWDFEAEALEVGLPEFNLAIQAMNNLNCKSGRPLAEDWLLRHSTSQYIWHDSTPFGERGEPSGGCDSQLHRDSEALVRHNGPFVHPACKCKLEALDRFRERNAYGTAINA